MWQQLWLIWKLIEPDEAGQGETEYMLLLSLAVLSALLVIVGLGYAVYALWDQILAGLPF